MGGKRVPSETGRRRTALLFALTLLMGLPIGYAVGQEGQAGSDYQPDPVYPSEPAEPDPGEVAYLAEGAPAERVAACRRDVTAVGDPLVCEMWLAIADGRLDPGSYSRAEIEEQQRIRAAEEGDP